jgi:hypothetical protein
LIGGFPLGQLLASSGNFTVGNITALTGMKDDSRILQFSAPVQPGNSGGALLNDRGMVLGVVTAKLDAVSLAATKDFDGLNGKWSFDANGDTTMDVMSGFKVVKADTPIGCKFEFVEVLK